MTIEQDIHRLGGNQLIDLYEIDATALGGSVSRICNESNALGSDVVWQGNTYTRFPVEVNGFEYSGKGQLPRPTIRVANVTGLMGALVRDYNDLVGAKFTRRRTMVKYLDAVNFPARRNLLTYTDSLTEIAGGWTHGDAITSVLSGQMGPDGTLTATSFLGLSGNTVSTTGTSVYKSFTVAVGNPYTISVWVNPLSTGTLVIRYGATADAQTALFPLTIGTGWRRISATFTAGALGGTSSLALFGSSGGAISVSLSDAQAELGATVTSYQPVTGATWSQNPTADPTASLPDEIYYVDRKSTENKVLIEFELAPSFDVTGIQLPRRVIAQNVCLWRYRSAECGYAGASYFDANDATVGTLALDVCGKRLTSCKARFGTYAELPFGSFPAAGLTR